MKITATGSYLPELSKDNSYFVDELCLNTSPDWIKSKTGIEKRRFSQLHETTSYMGAEAARQTAVDPSTLDMIILATSTPDMNIPNSSCLIQKRIGATCPALDLNTSCSGFVYALDIANQYLLTGTHSKILVIGADQSSQIVDYSDRGTCIFFADGAGAVVVESENTQFLARHFAANGDHTPIHMSKGKMYMDGKAIWDFALKVFPDTVNQLAKSANIEVSDIDWIIPHQANKRMIAACTDILKYPQEQVVVNVDQYGNTLAATIPIALHEAAVSGKIQRGQIVALVGFGAGLSWGGLLLRY